jgi:hypothetical protein
MIRRRVSTAALMPAREKVRGKGNFNRLGVAEKMSYSGDFMSREIS